MAIVRGRYMLWWEISSWLRVLLPPIVSGIFIVLAVYLTVNTALWRFRKEKRWERQADAYEKILNALHDIAKYFEGEWARMEREDPEDEKNQKVWNDRREALAKGLQVAEGELSRQRTVAYPYISGEALALLSTYEEESDAAGDTTDWSEHLHLSSNAIFKCLRAMRELVRKELYSTQRAV
jgi:hypothetical protein